MRFEMDADGGITVDPGDCPDPCGQETVIIDGETVTAHEVMLEHAGHCPWCGEESE